MMSRLLSLRAGYQLTQNASAARKTRHHRPQRRLRYRRYLLVRHLLELAHDDHFSVFRWQCLDRSPHLRGRRLAQSLRLWSERSFDIGVQAFVEFGQVLPRHLSPDPREISVAHDCQQPHASIFSAKRVEEAKGAKNGFL